MKHVSEFDWGAEAMMHNVQLRAEWGQSWRYADYTLASVETGYEVWLDELRTSAQVLDVVCQIARKTWATPTIMGHLVMALDHLLDPQSTMCGDGRSRRVAGSTLRTMIDGRMR